MNGFKKEKIVYVEDYRTMNKILKEMKLYCKRIEDDLEIPEIRKQESLRHYYQLKEGRTYVSIKCAPNIYDYANYIFYLDKREHEEHTTGMQAFSNLQKVSHSAVVNLSEDDLYYYTDDDGERKCRLCTIAGLLYFNQKYTGGRYEHCYSYDINSSYAWAMLKDMPDTSKEPRLMSKVKKNEIGFIQIAKGTTEEVYLYAVGEGNFAEYIFPKMESPFRHFVEYYYNKKKTAKDKAIRQKYKDTLNFAIGYIRRKNPFIHSAILTYARERVEALIDDNTLYCNTDSIISLTRREDIEQDLGEEVGQWKSEHRDESFAYIDTKYQWGKSVPVIRGVPKNWFKKKYPDGFDILKDTIPNVSDNYYVYNDDEMVVSLNRKEEE